MMSIECFGFDPFGMDDPESIIPFDDRMLPVDRFEEWEQDEDDREDTPLGDDDDDI